MEEKEILELLKKKLKLKHTVEDARFCFPTTHTISLELDGKELGKVEISLNDEDKDYI